MRRREFILFGGAAIAPMLAPLRAGAQMQSKPVVGFLNSRSPADSKHTVAAFHRGLAEHGFVDGQNVTVEFRWALGQYERLPTLAAELVRLPVSVLTATGGAPSALAAKAATSAIPVVFGIGSDPVKAGLVASYSRPGGNATGVNILTRALETKRIGLLREVVPRASTIGFLINLSSREAEQQLAEVQKAVRSSGIGLRVLRANSDQQIDAAFEVIGRERIPALVVGADAFYDTRRVKLVELAAKYAVPAVYQFREFAAAGGLMSYGIDLPDVYRNVGSYAGRILKGAKPADLPVLQPTKFEFVLNQRTAKALGLELTPNVLSLVDEVIE